MAFFEQYQWLSSCVGLEIHIQADHSVSVRMCEISLAGTALSIDAKWEVAGDLAIVLKKVPVVKPIALTVTGKGILTKKVPKEHELNADKLLRVFPNIDPGQFYIQNFISGEASFISVVRKEVLNTIYAALNQAGAEILLVNLGPFAASHILKQVNFYGRQMRFDGHIIALSELDTWDDYKYSAAAKADFPLKIGIEAIAEHYVLAYAAAFQLALYHKLNPVILPVEAVSDHLDCFEQKLKFNFRFAALLGLFFVLLLFNFLIFSYYSSKNDVLLAQVNQSTASIENVQQTQNEIQQNEQLLKELGWYKGISHAWLADQIGQSLPSGIRLSELAINPLNVSESNRLRKEVFKPGTIEITGESDDLVPVNEFIYQLKSKSWLQRANLDRYAPSAENDKQQFAITIHY
jgi:Tfp pilus assembly protein PilN